MHAIYIKVHASCIFCNLQIVQFYEIKITRRLVRLCSLKPENLKVRQRETTNVTNNGFYYQREITTYKIA